MQQRFAIFLLALALCRIASAAPAPAIELKDGDNHLVFLGGGLIEQAQFNAYLETRLTRLFPSRHLYCSNLGWSGDDVWGSARTAGYQNPAKFERLMKETTGLKPDILFVGYGFDESFAGAEGLPHFIEGYNQLLDQLAKLTPKLVLISPTFGEDLGKPLPDEVEHNRDVEQYTAAIKTIAETRHLPFVDLFHPLVEAKRANPEIHFTHNGVLLNDAGYWIAAREIENQLGLHAEPVHVSVTSDGKVLASAGAKVETSEPAGGLHLKLTDAVLPAPAAPASLAKIAATMEPPPVFQVSGLAPGDWTLSIDGSPAVTASAAQWNSGVAVTQTPDAGQTEKLRQALAQRNDLYYRRWRPFNDHSRHWTYMAGDFGMYDKEIAGVDEKIAGLTQPVAHVYTLAKK
ncbi:MAG TPA: SGNH/GDSL hydrolase family protein [Tepidisphaeraceae bacterium]|nr:SGNH/GDSL hydrolase family protein [Tepidisphaeraceae bacterium]